MISYFYWGKQEVEPKDHPLIEPYATLFTLHIKTEPNNRRIGGHDYAVSAASASDGDVAMQRHLRFLDDVLHKTTDYDRCPLAAPAKYYFKKSKMTVSNGLGW